MFSGVSCSEVINNIQNTLSNSTHSNFELQITIFKKYCSILPNNFSIQMYKQFLDLPYQSEIECSNLQDNYNEDGKV